MINYCIALRRKLPATPVLRLLLLAGPGCGWAQAPAWQAAVCSGNSSVATGESVVLASAVDAAGNVFITGGFTGSVSFGSIVLSSAGIYDMFVAKWDATAQSFTWATSGGGTSADFGNSIAVRGTSVFVTGASGTGARIAGQVLSAGGQDMFIAKFIDTSTGHTPATSSFANAWATSGGGTLFDEGTSIAVNGTDVFVTGTFISGTSASIAGQALAGAGRQDVFIAKYVDTSTGNTPATSSFINAWATSGGGAGYDAGLGVAVRGTGVFVTGYFRSGTSASIAGQALAGAGGNDVFVAKYLDTSTGSTPATSSFINAWATSSGGVGDDTGQSISVSSTNVFVTGFFRSGTSASFSGQTLIGAGGNDAFVAKYVDTSTGSTPATSSFANAWATSGGGIGSDSGQGLVISGQQVYAVGAVMPPATFGNIAVGNAGGGQSYVLARLTDPTLPLATAAPTSAATSFVLYPNPVSGHVHLAWPAAQPTTATLRNSLGQVVLTHRLSAANTDADLDVRGLPSGVYTLHLQAAGTALARRLVLE